MEKRGQVWIETVTYTLVAFVLISLVLAFAKPKIDELQDQSILEQSSKMIKEMDYIIQEILEKGVGNKRKVEINLRKGDFTINSENNSLIFYLEGKYMYSQPNEKITDSGIDILTVEKGKNYFVTLEKKYDNINITYMGKEESKKITKSSNTYTFFITNKGGENNTIDFQIE